MIGVIRMTLSYILYDENMNLDVSYYNKKFLSQRQLVIAHDKLEMIKALLNSII
jgi:hypothetical protein